MKEAPKEYSIEGLEITGYSKPDDKCEAVEYMTPNGAKFTIAKDFMGIQICKGGYFWPIFMPFSSMTSAVGYLRNHLILATAFFNEVARMEDKNEVSKV